ncbi:cytochrome P450 [Aspergillus granulosus]|uniref:Cytochrome P450 n=1 Tax=Aspergillus granulosus TaxID=176169 RepID=A0ABR4HD82_9EURO
MGGAHSVVGPHRSPTFDDEPELVYVKAFVKEVLRCRSVAIIGGQPHAPIKDDTYNIRNSSSPLYRHYMSTNINQGWLIPKNTWVQGNVWAIHHHEREFPDPDRFNPDRSGRRVCSGQGLAEQGTFITIARLFDEIRATIEREGLQALQDLSHYNGETKYQMSRFYATDKLE